MKAMSTSLIVRSHEALVTLKSCPMTTIYKPILNWCFGRWLNRWLSACDGKKKKTQLVSIHASYSKIEGLPSIHCQQKIEPTQSTKVLSDTVLRLFRSKYEGGAIRQIGVFYGELVEESLQLFSLFDDPIALGKEEKNSSRPLTAFGINLALPLFRKAPHY